MVVIITINENPKLKILKFTNSVFEKKLSNNPNSRIPNSNKSKLRSRFRKIQNWIRNYKNPDLKITKFENNPKLKNVEHFQWQQIQINENKQWINTPSGQQRTASFRLKPSGFIVKGTLTKHCPEEALLQSLFVYSLDPMPDQSYPWCAAGYTRDLNSPRADLPR